MILKIQNKYEDAFGWHFIDHIKNASFLTLHLTEKELKAQVDMANMIYFSAFLKDMSRFKNKNTGKILITKIFYRTNYEDVRTVLTNMQSYLLNDDGQTIEGLK
jgi:hypothetical protein